MLRRLRNEALLTGSMLTAVVGLSVLGYVLLTVFSPSPRGVPSGAEPPDQAEPPTFAWQPTGEYRTARTGIGLTVHSVRINRRNIAVVYSLDHSTPGLDASPMVVAITDDLGRSYDVVSNSILGTSLGVTAGFLTVEPYIGDGKTLTLTVTGVTASSGGDSPAETVPGAWSVTFVENRFPGAPVDYSEGGRIAPEVVSAGEITMAIRGQPGGPFVKLLIDRTGEQTALYGLVSDGVAQPLTETEFHEQLAAYTGGVDDYPPPGPPWEWPAPADVP